MVLAPMADVTDAVFRRIIAKYGKPDVFWTEFVSADGLCHPTGKEKLLVDLRYGEEERPIVAQLFTSNPDKMREAARLVKKLGFDGLDINMGCPDKKVEKQQAGAALIKNPKLARELIRAAKEGAKGLPVSVKTRLGYNKDELEVWLPELLAEDPAVITVHARTRKEMSDVSARWERVRRAVEIRDGLNSKTLILGNGDVLDLSDARKKVLETGCDGVMLGRAIFGNPWLFVEQKENSITKKQNPNGKKSKTQTITTEQKLKVLVEHTNLFENLFKNIKNFAVMKKHFKAYVGGFDGSKELRVKLMDTKNAGEVETIIAEYLRNLSH